MVWASVRYQRHCDRPKRLRMSLRKLPATRVRFSDRRFKVLLRRDVWRMNATRMYRWYTEDGLTVRTKMWVKAAQRHRVSQAVAAALN